MGPRTSRTNALDSTAALPNCTHYITLHSVQIRFIPLGPGPNPSRCCGACGRLFVGLDETAVPSEPGRSANAAWPHRRWANWFSSEEVSLPPLSANVLCLLKCALNGRWAGDVQCVCLCVGRESHQCRGSLGICDGYLLSCCFTRTHVVRAFCEQFSLKWSLPLGEIIDHRTDLSFLLLSCHHSPDERGSELTQAMICSFESLHARGNKHNDKLVVLLYCVFYFPGFLLPGYRHATPLQRWMPADNTLSSGWRKM